MRVAITNRINETKVYIIQRATAEKLQGMHDVDEMVCTIIDEGLPTLLTVNSVTPILDARTASVDNMTDFLDDIATESVS